MRAICREGVDLCRQKPLSTATRHASIWEPDAMDLVKSGTMLSTRHSRESGNPEVAGFCGSPPGLPVPWGDGFSAQILSKARNLMERDVLQ